MCAKIAYGFWKKRSTISSVCSLSCEKSERNWHPHRYTKAWKAKQQCVYSRILPLWQKVYVKRYQHQFTDFLNSWTFRRYHWDEFQLIQELKSIDHPMSFRFVKWACDRLTDADFGKKKIIFSDEAHFDLDGYVNKQNCRIWDTKNPHAYIEKPTHPKRVTVWCGFWSRDIIG